MLVYQRVVLCCWYHGSMPWWQHACSITVRNSWFDDSSYQQLVANHTPSGKMRGSPIWLVLHDVGESHFNFNHIQTLVSPMKPLFEILLVRSQNKAIMGYNWYNFYKITICYLGIGMDQSGYPRIGSSADNKQGLGRLLGPKCCNCWFTSMDKVTP